MNNFYKRTLLSGIASDVTLNVRKKIFNFLINTYNIDENFKILDLGVTSDNDVTANYLENHYFYPENITCVTIQDKSLLKKKFPKCHIIQINPNDDLPFKEKYFDLIYCNAVIEHVGDTNSQISFFNKYVKYGKNFFFTTPYRWFPVETHTHIPFLHYLPQHFFRFFLKKIGDSFYSKEENLNLLDIGKIKLITKNKASFKRIRTLGFTSNIVFYNDK